MLFFPLAGLLWVVGRLLARATGTSREPVRLVLALNEQGMNGIVNITQDGETVGYFIDRVPADFGTAYRLDKFSGAVRGDGDEHYHVHLDGERHSCECKGFLYHGYCRHILGLLTLLREGKL